MSNTPSKTEIKPCRSRLQTRNIKSQAKQGREWFQVHFWLCSWQQKHATKNMSRCSRSMTWQGRATRAIATAAQLRKRHPIRCQCRHTGERRNKRTKRSPGYHITCVTKAHTLCKETAVRTLVGEGRIAVRDGATPAMRGMTRRRQYSLRAAMRPTPRKQQRYNPRDQ